MQGDFMAPNGYYSGHTINANYINATISFPNTNSWTTYSNVNYDAVDANAMAYANHIQRENERNRQEMEDQRIRLAVERERDQALAEYLERERTHQAAANETIEQINEAKKQKEIDDKIDNINKKNDKIINPSWESAIEEHNVIHKDWWKDFLKSNEAAQSHNGPYQEYALNRPLPEDVVYEGVNDRLYVENFGSDNVVQPIQV